MKLSGTLAKKNPNFRSRCRCDQTGPCNSAGWGSSYVTIDYNYKHLVSNYRIVVRLRHYGIDYYKRNNDVWTGFVKAPAAYCLWTSSILSGPAAPGRDGYFMTGNNQTPPPPTGTVGVEAVVPDGSNRLVWWGLWDFNAGWDDWGKEWLRCGHDYWFWFEDQ